MTALAWFGMWMGLTSKSVNFATFKTLVFVQIIPWFVMLFSSVMVMATTSLISSVMTSSWSRWVPYITALSNAALSLAKDFGFIAWTRQRLYSSFRERASRNWAQPVEQAAPLPPLPVTPPPPIISAPVSR